jgi:hypothetical protein
MMFARSSKFLGTAVFFCSAAVVFGQLPASDLYLCKIHLSQKNIVTEAPVFLNAFNEGGYNNQPFFADYNTVFISTSQAGKKTDLFQLDLEKKEFFRFTDTENINEFSPQIHPAKSLVHTVRIEKDGKTQTLWAYPLDRSNIGYNVLPSLTNIGYYAWLNDQKVALFLVDSLPALAIADIKTGQVLTIQENVGRCLKVKDGSLFFTQKTPEGLHKVKRYDVTEQTIQNVFVLPQSVEDFDLLNEGKFIFGNGSSLFIYNPNTSPVIQEGANLEKYGIRQIKRLVTARDRLIFVDQKS